MFGKHFSLSFSSTQLSHLLSFVFMYAPNQTLAAAILLYVFPSFTVFYASLYDLSFIFFFLILMMMRL